LDDEKVAAAFAAEVAGAVHAYLTLNGLPAVKLASPVGDAGGAITAELAFASRNDRNMFDSWVKSGLFTLAYPRLGSGRTEYQAAYGARFGPCNVGSVSQTGRQRVTTPVPHHVSSRWLLLVARSRDSHSVSFRSFSFLARPSSLDHVDRMQDCNVGLRCRRGHRVHSPT
jgi:hypothetical protein